MLHAMALRTHIEGSRSVYDRQERRLELYVKAAPLFRALGYRQVTMKALAHACGLTAPALYRYFPSKLDFATFPLAPAPEGTCAHLLARAADRHEDGLLRIRAVLESAVMHVGLAALAFDLAIQAGVDEPPGDLGERLRAVEESVTEVVLSCMPKLEGRARDLVHSIVSLVLAAGATRSLPSAEDMWRQAVPIARAYLVGAGVDPARFDRVFPLTLDRAVATRPERGRAVVHMAT